MIVYEHNAATALILVCVVGAVCVAAFSYWRFVRRNLRMCVMAGIRALFFALLAWCLFLPGLKEILTRHQKPRFVVLLDTSSSMRLAPSPDTPDRWTAARNILGLSWTDTVAAACDVETYAFAAEVGSELSAEEVASLDPVGTSSLLRNALKRVTARYTGLNVAGCLLLSDGMDTREVTDDWAAERRPFPIYTVRLEPEAGWEIEADVRVDTVATPRRVSVDWKTELKTVVSGEGTGGQPVTVQLYKDDALQQELPVLIPDAGGARDVVFELDHPEIGVFTYRVLVPPMAGESHTNNNEYAVSVQVVTARNHLLYVEGPPRWESKYLGRALRANRQMTPLVFLRGPQGRFMVIGQAGSMTPEMREEQLAFFKIVIVGNLDSAELGDTRAGNLVKFVEAGGSLVLLGGSKAWGENGFAASPLRKLLPGRLHNAGGREGTYRVRVTDAGRAHPAFAGDSALWDIIPPVRSVFPCSELTPGARSLVDVETPDGPQPIVVVLRYGQGKVAAVFTDSLWKWQLHPDAGESKPYRRFWDQLIAWLAPEEESLDGKLLDVFVDREMVFLGEEIEITVRGRKAEALDGAIPVRCMVTGPDERTVPFPMGDRDVPTASGRSVSGRALTFKADQPGLHVALAAAEIEGRAVQSDPVSFFVKPFTPESIPRPANTAVLQAIAAAAGGRYCDTPGDLDATLKALDFSGVEEEIGEYSSLWQRWLILGCLVALLTVEWVVRKTSNLP